MNNKKEDNMDDSQRISGQDAILPADESLNSLIIWNINKVIEKNPNLDLKEAIRATQERLESESVDANASVTRCSGEDRYLTCALLAWQQLGHRNVESLCRFIKENQDTISSSEDTHLHNPCDGNKTKIIPANVSNHSVTKTESYPNKNDYVIVRDDDFYSRPIVSQCSSPKSNFIIIEDEGSYSNKRVDSMSSSPRRWPSFRPCRSLDQPMAAGRWRSNASTGSVLRLPNTTSVVMRVDKPARPRPQPPPPPSNKPNAQKEQETLQKINDACCLDSKCVNKLARMEATTHELRERATNLAQREAERVALLERAEAAWRDLELNYQRRLRLSLEKEEDIARQMKKAIEERNNYKQYCGDMVPKLKEQTASAEKERERLNAIEKDLCARACERLKKSDELAREEATLADNLCKAAQLDRDLQFKEEQARRKAQCLESAIEIARALKFEAGRAMHSELAGMRDQMALVSAQLLEEDGHITKIKGELDELRKEKSGIVEDLEKCKTLCDGRIKKKLDLLAKKKEELSTLRDIVLECRCKMPVDMVVEAKRTPSLAALCDCTAEDKLMESCSCTSLRGELLSNLLSDLFCGLQSELSMTGAQMPCQLLKCLEEKHNWDKPSVVKTNLKNFFSKLLVGELDIAIATAIERYHARWVGSSCMDPRLVPAPGDELPDGWEKRMIERRAQQLASQLAEKMFEQKAEQLSRRAKEVMKTGPPPCECKPIQTEVQINAATFQLVMKPSQYDDMSLYKRSNNTSNRSSPPPPRWKRAGPEVTQLRMELKKMERDRAVEEEFGKMVLLSSEPSCEVLERKMEISKKNPSKSVGTRQMATPVVKQGKTVTRSTPAIKRSVNNNINNNIKNPKKYSTLSNATFDKQTGKTFKRTGQTYAVNVCLCGTKDPQKINVKKNRTKDEDITSAKHPHVTDVISQGCGLKQSKPISTLQSHMCQADEKRNKHSIVDTCKSSCVCLNKIPSNTSIDKLLKALTKWTHDLSENIADHDSALKKKVSGKNKINDNNVIVRSILNSLTLQSTLSKCLNNETLASYNINSQSDKVCPEMYQEFPVATADSEYMGAVNLDKSNEVVCKCVNHNAAEKPGELKSHEISSSYKCIKSCNCLVETKQTSTVSSEFTKNNVSVMVKNLEENTKAEFISKEPTIQDKLMKDSYKVDNFINITPTVNNQESKMYHCLKKITSEINDDVLNLLNSQCPIKSSLKKITDKEQNTLAPENINHNVQTTEFPAYDNDYHIEFLGVTLTNENCDSRNTSNLNKIESISTQTKNNGDCALIEESQCQPNTADNVKLNFPTNLPTVCNSNMKFNEMETFFDNGLNKQLRDYNYRHEDKNFDTESLPRSIVIKDQKSCVCCQSAEKDSSNDLEVNTFQLLEEHLKMKLDELKHNCLPFCLPSKEEDKLYSALLQKIKQVIADSTDKVSCKCSEKQAIEGSWNRAYNLLQEYLKVKISRVKCLCASTKNMSTNEILPKVIEKVCSLIEKDFQRLKEKCLSKDTRKQISYKEYSDEAEIEMPERDKSSSEEIIVDNAANVEECLQYLDCSNSPINSKLVSNKMTLKFDLEDKGCDPVVYSNMLIKTQELQVIGDQLDPNIYSQTNFDQSKLDLADTITVQHAEVLTTNIKRNECNEKKATLELKETAIEQSSQTEIRQELVHPYIGYTVECSCDQKLGFRTCNRESVLRYNNKVQKLWQTLTSNKINENYSYVMNNVHKKVDNVCNVDVNEEYFSLNFIRRDSATQFSAVSAGNDCDIKSSYEEGEIVLKDFSFESKKEYNENSTEINEEDGDVNITAMKDFTIRREKIYNNKNISETKKNKSGTNVAAIKDFIIEGKQQYIENSAENNKKEINSNVTAIYKDDDCLQWYECGSLTNVRQQTMSPKSVRFHRDHSESVKADIFIDSHEKCLSNLTAAQDCECNMVPICHVKMLVDNIENKLIHSECTCDSMSAKVCPIHSIKNEYIVL